MFKIWKFALVVCLGFSFLGLVCVSHAFAFPQVIPSPALNGPTGLVRIPSADCIPYKNFNIAADYGSIMPSAGGSSESVIAYKMNLGTFHGLELGIVGGSERGTNQLREGVFVNMKLALSTGDDPYPLLLALGVENLFSYTQTDVYMVATKYLKQGPKLTFGFMADFPNYKFRPLGMAGVELAISDNFFLMADLMAGESLFQTNAGLRFYFTPIFSLNISALNVLDATADGVQAKDPRSALIGFSWANPF
ncbi:MAG: hypothetical protein PHH14_06570 [Candidatus Margulisbacteria bacterium]|nr:hypothetical protein [Candidatus Margulisiibacteriota bacterium]